MPTTPGTIHNHDVPWCAYKVASDLQVDEEWGNCAESVTETVVSTSTKTCSGSDVHVCNAEAIYGGVEVDFGRKNVKMSVFFPTENELISHEISYGNGTTPDSLCLSTGKALVEVLHYS